MRFIFYDLIFLALFILLVIILFFSRKKGFQRQGILLLYKTKFGIQFIDKFAKKFESILKPTRYVVLVSGYILMASIIWLLIKVVYIYLTTSVSQFVKAPPVAPLIPYFPKIFGLDSFFPPLYFTYFIIALSIVAISHEFSHGIFARIEKFKIHSTGFAFLGPIIGAFVEPDEKQMQKAKKFPQLSVLGAGTFANVIMTVLFGIILMLFFTSAFIPAGIRFQTYALASVNVPDILIIGPSQINENLTQISVQGKKYVVETAHLQQAQEENHTAILVFYDSPALNAQLEGIITQIDGKQITSREILSQTLETYSPGDKITITTFIQEYNDHGYNRNYEIELTEMDGQVFLGIGFFPTGNGGGVLEYFYEKTIIEVDHVNYYKSSLGNFGWFIYYLLWWVVFINFLVALFNMLPIGILDGGRFFYLTIWGLTGSEKVGKKTFALATWFIILIFVILMVKWATAFF